MASPDLLFAPAVFSSQVRSGSHGEVKGGSPLVGALEGAVVIGGVSALGAALMQIGVPKDQTIKYETALKADKFVLVVHGSAEDEAKVRSVLASSKVPQTV